MPYSKSNSREAFELNSELKRKLALEASYKNRNIKYAHQQLIYQSTIFQLCALMEDYFKSLVEDLIFSYKTKGATLNELPIEFRTSQLISSQIGSYQSHLNQPDQSKIIKKLCITKPFYNLLNDSEPFTNQIHPATIINTNKYPSEKNIKKLFQRFGFKDIFISLSTKYHKDFKVQLKSFTDVRESIAHQTPPQLTYQDVKRSFKNMNEIIDRIDRIVYRKIVETSSAKYW